MGTALRVRALRKRMGRHQALDGVDLRVETGEVYGLLGPNGAGKTTLMKIIAGLARAGSGEVELFGRPFERGALRDVGALVVGPGLWSRMNAVQHLRLHARLRGVDGYAADAVPELLRTVGLEGVAERRVSAYSLGMRWRLGIAIALLARPRLLVLDEPTNGLDPVGMRDMRELLRRLAGEGVTVFVSSHQLDQIAHTCDRIGVLVAGATRYEGPLDGLAVDGDLEQGFFDLLDRTSAAVR
ncbi:ABC transporter ATP-binding protein [Marinitenerispora sediminis]|uniref:Lantibiotic ABC transporter ATP-binding protein n=1 Tax=Marinitenerispora sediminis TaxID=1931232 RepID=A0A368TA03_9ACTN|nr:ATP-binding cassette domain-containing protein [Marinitenerispora sediminis]RCV52801.1 lantibiotic ABC transporter ATP-binding protein [Marinitenerispora sediminis]RCV59906.1 lantibiotic ABC transporter ATP-binding protein [Marinitenerispora sediminis]RCV61322.1 lantibiotic ABC transporter ATP-binding protein [Marinitenerispora sediminis]